jgi:hypothetical protein
MFSITRTIWGIGLNNANMRGNPYKPMVNTTLNESMKIFTNPPIDETRNPLMQYFIIGIGNTPAVNTSNNSVYLHESNRLPIHNNLFKICPFVVRTIDNDLDDESQKAYRLKKKIIRNGVEYFVYFAKKFSMDKHSNIIMTSEYSDGDEGRLSYFEATDPEIQSPTPKIRIGDVLRTPSKYIFSVDKILIELSSDEQQDILDAIKIYNGVEENVVINELALISGKDFETDDGGVEIGDSQVMYFVNLTDSNELELGENVGFYKEIDVGGTEPLFYE